MFAMPYKSENDFFLGIFGERYQMEFLSDQKSTHDLKRDIQILFISHIRKKLLLSESNISKFENIQWWLH